MAKKVNLQRLYEEKTEKIQRRHEMIHKMKIFRAYTQIIRSYPLISIVFSDQCRKLSNLIDICKKMEFSRIFETIYPDENNRLENI